MSTKTSTTPKPARRMKKATAHDGTELAAFDTYEEKLSSWLDHRETIIDMHLRERP